MPRDDEPLAVEIAAVIHAGDVPGLRRLLTASPGLAREFIVDAKGGGRTPLHIVTDWPGFFPDGPEVARVLLAAGADPDARTPGEGFRETPLHWAASSDDADVARALIDGGADVEMPDGSIGTPLDNASGTGARTWHGCWRRGRARVRHLTARGHHGAAHAAPVAGRMAPRSRRQAGGAG